VSGVIARVSGHEITLATLEVARHALATVAPLSRMFVLHRLMALLVPARWVRAVLEAVVVPVVIALAAPIASAALLVPATTSRPTPDAASALAGTVSDVRSGEARPDARPGEQSIVPDAIVEDHTSGQGAEPLNRAERRAMQQAQARARKTASHRPGAS